MPKENIKCDPESPKRVELSWAQRGAYGSGCVGIATVNMNLEQPGTGDVPEDYNGFYVNLNREGINRLIRSLRRARDSAFGKDE